MKQMSDERAEYIAQALDDETIETSPQVEFRDPIKELGFARIEHVITLDAELSDGAYRTYALLHYYWQRKDAAWVGSDTLASVRNLTEATISNHLKELKEAGLISRQRRMGKSSMTYLEDLPERYAEAAKLILSKRKKSLGKLSKKLDDSPKAKSMSSSGKNSRKNEGESNQNDVAMRTIEEEPLNENHVGAKIAPPPSADEPISHRQDTTQDDSFSAYANKTVPAAPLDEEKDFASVKHNTPRTKDERNASVRRAAEQGEQNARSRRGKRGSVVSSPWDAANAETRQIAAEMASIGLRQEFTVECFERQPSAVVNAWTWKAKQICDDIEAKKITREKVMASLAHFKNGGGKQFDKWEQLPTPNQIAQYVMTYAATTTTTTTTTCQQAATQQVGTGYGYGKRLA